MVRAKFKVQNLEDFNEGKTITLHPVYTGSAENYEFYKYTPGGVIQLSTVNVKAAEQFEVGKEFYVDFTPADTEDK